MRDAINPALIARKEERDSQPRKALTGEDIIAHLTQRGDTAHADALRNVLAEAEKVAEVARRATDRARLAWAVTDGVYDALAYGPALQLPYSTGRMNEAILASISEYLERGTLDTVPVPENPKNLPGVFPIYLKGCGRCENGNLDGCQEAGEHQVPGQSEIIWQDAEGLVRYYRNGSVSFHGEGERGDDHLTDQERTVLAERYSTWPDDADVSLPLRQHWDRLEAVAHAERQQEAEREATARAVGRLPKPGVQLTDETFPAERRHQGADDDAWLVEEFGEVIWSDEQGVVRYYAKGPASFHDTGGILQDDGLTRKEAAAMARHYEETVIHRRESPQQRDAINSWLLEHGRPQRHPADEHPTEQSEPPKGTAEPETPTDQRESL